MAEAMRTALVYAGMDLRGIGIPEDGGLEEGYVVGCVLDTVCEWVGQGMGESGKQEQAR